LDNKQSPSETFIGELSSYYLVFLIQFLHSEAQSGGHEVWQLILDMVKNVSEAMLSQLPTFWKIAKSFQEGKFKRVGIAVILLHKSDK
jgi:hypothetical protein